MSLLDYYEGPFDEDARLDATSLEWLRSTELIGRVLPPPPARVADIAGGTGHYAAWLARAGHTVSLLDLVPSHVEQARARAERIGLEFDCVVGDARSLPWPDESFDVVLVMGALYHLQDADDRLTCLAEARRVLRPGGALAVACISRWASLVDAYRYGFVANPDFIPIMEADLATGRHENPSGHPHWFTTAYFHTPAEIAGELAQAGFDGIQVIAVEGFAAATGAPESMRLGAGQDLLLAHIRRTEAEPSLLGMSSHLMGLARRPAAFGAPGLGNLRP